MRLATLSLGFALGAIVFIGASLVLAWTGPTSAPPNGNISAPINVGATDQVKNAGLAVNSLAVFGNAILAGVSSYLNFGATSGSSGYGIRDNAGTLEVKNNSGNWSAMLSASSTLSQIKFADGTTQTTAASVTAQTSASCAVSAGGTCSVSCPVGYFRSGCSASCNIAGGVIPSSQPSGSGCSCAAPSGFGGNGTCYIYCVK